MSKPAPSVSRLAQNISCHAWNADGTKVAISPNNNEILIYAKTAAGFQLEHTLREHDQVVTGLDWAPKSNKILSCSHDRNAYVWSWEGGAWKPGLVILRINRCATYCKWSPKEDKFAVSNGEKSVAVCFFEEENNWWVSKLIKKHRSTVMRLDWHPNNLMIATAAIDFKCRIFSARLSNKEPALDAKFGKAAFGDLLHEFEIGAWVRACRWSPSGNLLAFVGHDSSLSVTNISGASPTTETLKLSGLPFCDLIFWDEGTVVAAGFDCTPVLFQSVGGRWQFIRQLDTGGHAAAASKSTAFTTFQNKVDKDASSVETTLKTKHQNCITWLSVVGKAGKYCTTGNDGNIFLWDKP